MKIETGVDKLLELVKQKKKVMLSDAVRELNVPKDVVLDWADVLEDAQEVVVKYVLFKPVIVLKEFSSEELKKKAKELKIKKEGLQRRVESALKNLEYHGAGLENFKKSFSELKEEVNLEIMMLKKELEELERLEEEKKRLSALAKENPKAMKILKQAKETEQQATKIKEKILKKASSTRIHPEEKKKIIEKFKAFFDKKNEAAKLLAIIEDEYKQIEDEYQKLLEEAKKFDVHDPKTSKDVSTMEKHLLKLKEKKERMIKEIEQLHKIVVGR